MVLSDNNKFSELKETFGKRGTDKVTGFSGTIIGACSYITGCDQLLVSAPSKENGKPESIWYDTKRVEVGEITVELEHSEGDGCDLAAPIK